MWLGSITERAFNLIRLECNWHLGDENGQCILYIQLDRLNILYSSDSSQLFANNSHTRAYQKQLSGFFNAAWPPAWDEALR